MVSKSYRDLAIEVKLPFILLKTDRLLRFYEKVAGTRLTRVFSWISIFLLPFVAAGGILLLVNSVMLVLTRPEVQEAQREAGPQSLLLIPGINPYLPIIYGWIGILVAIIAHESMHGIIARMVGYQVKTTGMILFLGIPIGAFVEINEEELKSGKTRDVARVLSGGPISNVAVATLCLVGLLIIITGLQPALGIIVSEVLPSSSASEVGIMPGDEIIAIDDKQISSLTELRKILESKKFGEYVTVSVLRKDVKEVKKFNVELRDLGGGHPMIGVKIANSDILEWSVQYLDSYKNVALKNPIIHLVPPSYPTVLHPYSDRVICSTTNQSTTTACFDVKSLYIHPLFGQNYYIIANLLFWIWFVNINVAIFNALPIYPLDGGQALRKLFSITIGKKLGEKSAFYLSVSVTLVLVGLIFSLIMVPYLALLA
ncbi:MAG: site-2 protease family protein [Nitrososphaerota archaeon]